MTRGQRHESFENQQAEATRAVARAKTKAVGVLKDFSDVQRLRAWSVAIEAQHRELQRENHFGPRLFGMER